MHAFTSEWLKRKVIKSSAKPAARVLNLFAILQDWMDAPGMREHLNVVSAASHQELHAFILSLVTDAKLQNPEKLTFQLLFLLMGALNDEQRNPGCNAMERAGKAAAVMVASAQPRLARLPALASASFGLVAVVITAWSLMPTPQQSAHSPTQLAGAIQTVAMEAARPDQLAAIYQLHDRLQSGQCSYPQALMLAANQRALFLDGVVNLDKLNTTASNLNEVSQLYKKVDCSYAPTAMLL